MLFIQKYICTLMLMTIYECNHFMNIRCHLYIYYWKCTWLLDFIMKKKHLYIGFEEYLVNARDSWFKWKVHPPPHGSLFMHPLLNPCWNSYWCSNNVELITPSSFISLRLISMNFYIIFYTYRVWMFKDTIYLL